METVSRVDIHIVTYNNQKTIRQCLRAACRQDYGNISILLIDNHSTDRTVELASAFPISFVVNRLNAGYAKAHNQALAMSHGSFVLTLNPDVKLDRRYVSRAVAAFRNAPNVGSVAGLLLRVNSLEAQSHIIDAAGVVMKRNRQQGLRLENSDVRTVRLTEEEVFGPDGAAAMYRRSMLEDIAIRGEIFDEDFFMHKEDIDVIWRARIRGWKSRFTPRAKAYHVRTFRPGQRKQVSSGIRLLGLRNRYCLVIKNDRLINWLQHLPYILIYDIGVFLYVLIFEHQSFGAYGSFLGLLPKMQRKRKYIMKNRKASRRSIYSWFI